MNKILVNEQELVNIRLDKLISMNLSEFSRSKIQDYIEKGLIKVNGKIEKSSYKTRLNDEVTIDDIPVENLDLVPQDIPLDIIYEDDDVMVINKPKGLVVHPGAGVVDGTLANALKFHSESLSSVNGEFRPGIVHRIDKDTTGLLVVAKNDKAHTFLASQLQDHTLRRKYYALVLGNIVEENGTIIAPIGRDLKNRLKMAVDLRNGKEAVTHFEVLRRFKDYTFVECELETGRTHQIRVHLEYIKHPVIGDPIYGKGNRVLVDDGQLLHAHEITFVHPRTKEEVTFNAPLPDNFEKILDSLK